MTVNRIGLLVAVIVVAGVLAVVGLRVLDTPFEPTTEQRTAFVESQAQANCLVQRTVYPTREKLDAAYQAAVLSTGLDAATVKKLHDYENRNQAIRVAISDRVRALCAS